MESPTFMSVYANDTQVQISPWDIRLIYGVIDSPPTPERPTILVKTVGEVRMSPQHAKKVAQLLTKQVALFEDAFGPVSVPD